MKRTLCIALAFAAAVVATSSQSSAQIKPPGPIVMQTDDVHVDNKLPKNGVWITAYRGTIIGRQIIKAWCVGPNQFNKHTLYNKSGNGVDFVRFEVTQPNCGHPVRLDRTLESHGGTFVLTESGGNVNIQKT